MLHYPSPLTREQLRTFPVPTVAPFQERLERRGCTSRYWQPIGHGALADALVQGLEGAGLTVVNESWGVCRRGHALIGSVDVEVPGPGSGGVFIPDGTLLSCGVRHSNDGNWALTGLVGGSVQRADLEADLGFVASDFVMSRKHTTGTDLSVVVEDAVATYLERAAEVGELQVRLSEDALDVMQGDRLTLTMAEEGAYPWRCVRDISRAWRGMERAAAGGGGRVSAWDLYMAVSLAVRGRSAHDQIQSLVQARKILEDSGTWLAVK